MNYSLDIRVNRSVDELKKDTIDYFEKQNFTIDKNEDQMVCFVRGSVWGNMIAFNPLKWKSNICINFEDGLVKASFEINTIHQTVTPSEEKLWNSFVQNFKENIETGKSTISENSKQLQATYQSTIQYIGIALLGAILFGVPSGLISYFTGVDIIAPIGAVIGAMFLINRKIHKEKKGRDV